MKKINFINKLALKKVNLTPFILLAIAGCANMQPTERQPGQVYVCHDGNSITVSNPDYLRHIEHGDTAGPCAN